MKNSVLLILFFLKAMSYVEAQQDSKKHSYFLFHPVPKNLMRSFELDRPDATESDYS